MPCALVTGSSRGIGLGIAKALAMQGFDLIINAPSHSQALQTAEEQLVSMGVSVKSLCYDIADYTKHEQFIDEAFSAFGGVDCLVNNAGISVQNRGDLLNISVDSFNEQIDVNLRGTFFLTQTFAKCLLQNKHHTSDTSFQSIITISSSNAVAAAIERGEYCMAKSALSMMNKLFALRLADSGIRCYEVRPGLIETDMTLAVKDKYDGLLSKGFSPINRWGSVDDVGEAVASLACGAMKFSTGDVVHIDGGLLIQRY